MFARGDVVEHPEFPEWGEGRVTRVILDGVEADWSGTGPEWPVAARALRHVRRSGAEQKGGARWSDRRI